MHSIGPRACKQQDQQKEQKDPLNCFLYRYLKVMGERVTETAITERDGS